MRCAQEYRLQAARLENTIDRTGRDQFKWEGVARKFLGKRNGVQFDVQTEEPCANECGVS